MSNSKRIEELEEQREGLRQEIANIGDMRPGYLVGRYRKCGKPNCRCAREGEKGHGPSWSVTHRGGGKTRTKIIPSGPKVEETKQQITEYHRFRDLTRKFITTSEEICDARLGADQPSVGLEKGGFKKSSKRKLGRK